MAPLRVALDAESAAIDGLSRLHDARIPGAPVVDKDGVFLGSTTLGALEEAASSEPNRTLGHLVDVTAPTVQATAALDVALEALGTTHERWVTVTDSGQHVVGVFTASRLIVGYRRALAANTERLSRLAGDAIPVELCVERGAEAAGYTLRHAALPLGTIVVTIEREGALHFADGDTVLKPGDLISALARPDEVDALRHKVEFTPEIGAAE